jgi:hypothetical protein
MKLLVITAFAIGLFANQAFGQGAQADQIKRRAKELSNQNNVRQGVPAPSQPPAKPATAPAGAPAAAKPATPAPVATAQEGVAKLQADIAGIKAGSPIAPEQRTQFMKDIAVAVRGATKPSLPTVARFVNELTAALAEKALGTAEQARLAQDIEAVLNSAAMPVIQFDAVIADVQAILQVGGAKRAAAVAVANDLRAVGQEVRRAAR